MLLPHDQSGAIIPRLAEGIPGRDDIARALRSWHSTGCPRRGGGMAGMHLVVSTLFMLKRALLLLIWIESV